MKRKGFTLVELLIVIVVIGVLSTMMMLSSTEAVTSAKASNIISNLRNLKTAALSLYVNSLDQIATTQPKIAHVVKYMSNEKLDSDYNIAFSSSSNYDNASWYITCKVNDKAVRGKLAGRATSVGLLKASAATGSITTTDPYAGNDSDTIVCIKVR